MDISEKHVASTRTKGKTFCPEERESTFFRKVNFYKVTRRNTLEDESIFSYRNKKLKYRVSYIRLEFLRKRRMFWFRKMLWQS